MGRPMSMERWIVALALSGALGCATGFEGPAHRAENEDAGATRPSRVSSVGSIVVGAGHASSPTYRAQIRIRGAS